MPKSQIAFRPATSEDRYFVENVYFETQRWIIERLFSWRGDEVEKAKFAEFYDESNSRIITFDNTDVGWVTLLREKDTVELEGICICGAFQGKQIGTRILQGVIEEAASTNASVRLSTPKINPARRLYQRLGFRESKEDEFKVYMEFVPGKSMSPAGNPTP